MKVGYYYLAIAILSEVVATSALKSTEEFTRVLPSLIVIGGYVAAIYFLSLVLKTIPIGIAYAIWSGLGITLIAVVDAVLNKNVPDIPAMIGMFLIVSGVFMLNVVSKTVVHSL